MSTTINGAPPRARGIGNRILDGIEWVGNKLPDPIFLFMGCAIFVMILSAIGSSQGWSVAPRRPTVITQPLLDSAGQPVLDEKGAPRTEPIRDDAGKPKVELQSEVDPKTGEPVVIKVQNLLSADGLYWCLSTMVKNFINFPPLGIVLAGMLGIGVAEKVGLFGALIKWLALVTPSKLLTPTIVFIGIMSNVASDAGYIILPPLAAALYIAFGRPPVAGIAAAFAGVSAGFSANLLISPGDAVMSELTMAGARILDKNYAVVATCNWYFLAGSTLVMTLAGWFVTAVFVEPRLARKSPEDGGPLPVATHELRQQELSPGEKRALRWAILATMGTIGLVLALILIPGWPLHGEDPTARGAPPRWTQAVIPIIIALFLAPGIAYGVVTGTIASARDVAKAFIHAMGTMAPIIVLAFFAGQFIEYFKYSNLDRMLAFTGGEFLVNAGLPPMLLIAGISVLTLTVNLFMGSMSAKWTMLAPILVPMLMMVGLSPELTQAAYRVGDSVTNVVTPLNSYIIVILVALQRYAKTAGLGTLVAMMVPYSVVFGLVWITFLLIWVSLGIPLGPQGPLTYVPAQ